MSEREIAVHDCIVTATIVWLKRENHLTRWQEAMRRLRLVIAASDVLTITRLTAMFKEMQ